MKVIGSRSSSSSLKFLEWPKQQRHHEVTGATMEPNPYSRNVKLWSAIISVLWNIEPWSLHVAWGFRIWRIEWCDRSLLSYYRSEWVSVLCVLLWLVGSIPQFSLVCKTPDSSQPPFPGLHDQPRGMQCFCFCFYFSRTPHLLLLPLLMLN